MGLTVCAVVMSGCGTTAGTTAGTTDTQGSSGAGVPAAVKALVAEAGQPKPWKGPTTSPPMLKDKFIVSIPCSMASPGCARWDAGVHAAAKALGWKVLTIDPVFDTNKMNQAIQQAIDLHADAIVTTVLDPAWVASPLAAARRKGIVVLGGANGQEDVPITAEGFQHNMSLHGTQQGEWLAAQVCDDLNAEGHAIMITDPSFNVLTQRVDAVKSYLGKNCPKVSVKVEQVSANDVGTVLQNKVSAFVQRNPDVKALISPVDLFATDVSTALQQLGNHDVKVYSIDGNPDVIRNIDSGGSIRATVGSALEWEGWSTIDDVNRLLQGKPAPDDDGVPGRMVTKDYIPKDFTYTGDIDYKAMFLKLWKTGSTQK
ncbi:sugar ABC transporter substrate-binding protein [Streptomyces sp. NPDC005820]|uniref:sugar ABC transporter substrate-binding protein n=1 Tax=Streptomyces sp. NPDC005820 TaxID=3157069 RepID=UPI0033CA63BA